LKQIHDDYKSGKLLSSEIKKILIEVMIERVGRHKRARALVTEEVVDAFMAVRKMDVLKEKK
jgi:tryptophanyl-tRNA synthetase